MKANHNLDNNSSGSKRSLFLGLILLTLSIFFLVLLYSFDKNDPSISIVSDIIPKNYFGYFGSYLADIIITQLGFFTGVLIILVFSFLGFKFITKSWF